MSQKLIDFLKYLEYKHKFFKRDGTLEFFDPIHRAIFVEFVKNPEKIDEAINGQQYHKYRD